MTAVAERNLEQLFESKRGVLLDVGCGPVKQPGFIGMDYRPLEGVDIVHNWNDFPWPVPDESVLTILASHVVEHVNPLDGHFVNWMDECWRVLKVDGQLAITTPYAGSRLYWQDPTHINGCTESTWFYFTPDHESELYIVYQPKPWKIEVNVYHAEGLLEAVLRKIPESEVPEITTNGRSPGLLRYA